MAGSSADGTQNAPDNETATLHLATGAAEAGQRLDKALAAVAAERADLSRSRIAALIAEGALEDANGRTVTDARRKVKAGEEWRLTLPPPLPAAPEPEDIPLTVVHEDRDLIVIDKPAGMVVHPAPGAGRGTLVNALLHHCGESLRGIGGVRRPGIVHRIDKDTSGLLVAAKTQAAHGGLAALFADHAVDRLYRAVCWGTPQRHDPRIGGLAGVSLIPGWIRVETRIGRHPADRKRMAVLRGGREGRNSGREAITRLRAVRPLGPASLIDCRLETGRTHQIRVHAAYLGHALVGDPVYGRKGGAGRKPGADSDHAVAALRTFPRQALHAAALGFRHPVSGLDLRFESPLPPDMDNLIEICAEA